MLNTICLVGRVVHNPELKNTPTGNAVTTFAVAVERSRSGQDGQKVVDYIDVVAWRKTAEFVSKYFSKGSWIAVNGSLQTRTYEDKNGNKRKVYEVLADNVHFCGGKSEATTSDPLDKLNAFDVVSEYDEEDDDGDFPF